MTSAIELSDRVIHGLLLVQDAELTGRWDETSGLCTTLIDNQRIADRILGEIELVSSNNADYPGYDYMDQGGKELSLTIKIIVDGKDRFYTLGGNMDSYGNVTWDTLTRVYMRAVEKTVYEMIKTPVGTETVYELDKRVF